MIKIASTPNVKSDSSATLRVQIKPGAERPDDHQHQNPFERLDRPRPRTSSIIWYII